MVPSRHVVIGTAGHVDHGKTSLVKLLTGVDCDRLPEEQRRGITIELGFTSLALNDGVRASVIDVPGHEKFVRTMVAGAAGIDLVLLVVAADDAVMPQTREHLAICELLGVRAGVVALTKVDLVEDELAELARDDVESALAGTFLDGAVIVPCSSHDGRGLHELRQALTAAAAGVAPRVSVGRAILPIDRVFTKPGFGTVVTGTLLRGELRIGDELDVFPSEQGELASALKVRGLHVHDAAVDAVCAASRVAINLRGDGGGAIRKGSLVTTAGWQRPTWSVCVHIRLLPSSEALKRRSSLMLHLGTREVPVAATLLDGPELAPGARGVLRLRAAVPFPAYYGQRLILRRDDQTIGGGEVVDPHPPDGRVPREFRGQPFHLEPTTKGRVASLLAQARERGALRAEIESRLPPDDDVRTAIERLLADGRILAGGVGTPRYWDAGLLPSVMERAQTIVAEHHLRRPALAGIRAVEVATRLPDSVRALGAAAVAALLAAGRLLEEDGIVRLPMHDIEQGEVAAVRERVTAHYARAGMTPPLDAEARASLGLGEQDFADALTELKRRGVLRMLDKGLHFEVAPLHALKGRVVGWFAAHEELSTSDFKELSGGLSRKHAIPLLEWLDGEGTTRRHGDVRIAGPRCRVPP
jgi:selenocysteine-specific elongation factor